ncbi:glycosyltransferase [Synechococcus elongatus IITB4]|uniref:glycosyltransferase family 4 protein n=1 Tax=Synechococcus elongatus TaxID=32046 RepID=UPI0030D23A89
MTVLLALHRIGPYHHARFQAAAKHLTLTVLETRPQSQEYPWEFIPPQPVYAIAQLPVAADPEQDLPTAELDRQLQAFCNRLQPQAIVTVGWADRAYQRLLVLAQQRRIPTLIISDSRWRDQPRSFLPEEIKRNLLRGYSAAIVAGQESRAYLEQLGFPLPAIFQPWDVIDNAFFAQAPTTPIDTSLPPHFLCISRFIAKKNHQGLLEAYALYQGQGGQWGLKLVGSGPLESSIRQQIQTLPQSQKVQLQPFQQLEAIAQCYAQAQAFILASSSDQWGLVINEAMAAGLPVLVSSACGCAIDLVKSGISGWVFDPEQPQALAALLHQVEQQSPTERSALIAAARQQLERFSPETFAQGLVRAIAHAQQSPRYSRRATALAQLLSHR